MRQIDTYPFLPKGCADLLLPLYTELKSFKGLHIIGRCGMHRYHNMDHSALTGLLCADRILGDLKADPVTVNTDQAYNRENLVN